MFSPGPTHIYRASMLGCTGQHKIHLKSVGKPVQHRRYRMNPNYLERVRVELEKWLGAGFIHPVKSASWLSPIVMVHKKNDQLRVCVEHCKLNAQRVNDPQCCYIRSIPYAYSTCATYFKRIFKKIIKYLEYVFFKI